MLVADLRQSAVGHVLVGINRSVNIYVLANQTHECCAAGIAGDDGVQTAATLNHADNRRFAILTAKALSTLAGQSFRALVGVLVAVFAANVGFVHFYGVFKFFKGAVLENVADALEHKPSCLLSDV